jgi:iron(III) transport system substrate-binding protein
MESNPQQQRWSFGSSQTTKRMVILLLLVILIALPLLSHKWLDPVASGKVVMDKVVIISPHMQSTMLEFKHGFESWYFEKTGRYVVVDYRYVGGVNEIKKVVDSLYKNAFRSYWTEILGRSWSYQVADAWSKDIPLPEDPAMDTLAQAARRAFLASEVSCGIDVLFGCGVYEATMMAQKEFFIPATVFDAHPDWAESIPIIHGVGRVRDPQNRWIGTAFSLFGLIYNTDAAERIGFKGAPKSWADLTDPKLLGAVGLADPNKSGVVQEIFALIVQESLAQRYVLNLKNGMIPIQAQHSAVREGWIDGLRQLQLMSANARYFTEKSLKPVIDVASGNCVMGISTDFTGLAQQENIAGRGGSKRFFYATPATGSTALADVTAIFKGANDVGVAQAFVEYVISTAGQKLWCFPVGAPGGPIQFSLRRLPVRKEFYTEPQLIQYRTDSGYNPYETDGLEYHSEWLAPVLDVLQVLIKAAFMDPHGELSAAWAAIIEAQQLGHIDQANCALAVMQDFSGLGFDEMSGELRVRLCSGDPLDRIKAQSQLVERFLNQYRKAERIARGYALYSL